jgi:hypothetical protein
MIKTSPTLAEQPFIVGIAVIMSIRCRHELATRQLMQHIYRFESKVSTRMMQKIWGLLKPEDQRWLTSTIAPGMSDETYSEAAVRISKNTTEI